jgi:hypothetical protein
MRIMTTLLLPSLIALPLLGQAQTPTATTRAVLVTGASTGIGRAGSLSVWRHTVFLSLQVLARTRTLPSVPLPACYRMPVCRECAADGIRHEQTCDGGLYRLACLATRAGCSTKRWSDRGRRRMNSHRPTLDALERLIVCNQWHAARHSRIRGRAWASASSSILISATRSYV